MTYFFEKSIGNWNSNRIYFYPDSNRVIHLNSIVNWTEIGNNTYRATWKTVDIIDKSQVSEGDMEIFFDQSEHVLIRNRGYFAPGHETRSNILALNRDRLRTSTEYNNSKFIEDIEFLNDNIRKRTTVGYKKDEIFLVGNYTEFRIW